MNRRPALRVDDVGVHAACCGTNTWKAQQGAPTVFINGKPAFRVDDPSKHCGGQGRLIEGSTNVIVGDSGGGGGGMGTRSGSSPGGNSTAGASRSSSSAGASSSQAAPSSRPASSSRGPTSGAASSSGTPSSAVVSSSREASSSFERSPLPPSPVTARSPDADRRPPKPKPELTWIEIELVGEDGGPVAGERYIVVTPDGGSRNGFLDQNGRAKLDGLEPGTCRISFPDIDGKAWDPV